MKTFNDILTSKNFYESSIQQQHISQKTLNFILTSKNLQLLKHLVPQKIQKYIINIAPSKRNEKEILLTFNNYPMCLEFNKYYANNLLHTIKNNAELSKKLNLSNYQKITGYVAKKNLEPYHFITVSKQELQEKAQGEFINYAKNPKLRETFENLRNIIFLRHKHINEIAQQDQTTKPTAYNLANRTFWQ